MCIFFTLGKRGLTKDITCLKDFMNDPKREEPLVGMLFCFINGMSLNL